MAFSEPTTELKKQEVKKESIKDSAIVNDIKDSLQKARSDDRLKKFQERKREAKVKSNNFFKISKKNSSGIPAIDTLETYEWDVETNNNSMWKTLALGATIPGGAQYYTEHYVRAGFLTTLEVWLFYERFYNKPRMNNLQREKVQSLWEDLGKANRSIYTASGPNRTMSSAFEERKNLINQIRQENDIYVRRQDLTNSELAWALGLHLYGLFDGIGILMNNKGRSHEKIEPEDALWRGILVPGWGQIHNGKWGKAGLLYMALIGSYVSYHSRQNVVEYYKGRIRVLNAEGNTSGAASLQEDLKFYRKKRNQYIWGPVFIYIYSLGDATVDAMLSDFDSPINLTVVPSKDFLSPEILLTWVF